MKKLKKQVGQYVGAGVMIGAGSAVLGGMGASTAGMATMGGMMSPIGATIGGTAAIRMVRKLKPKHKWK